MDELARIDLLYRVAIFGLGMVAHSALVPCFNLIQRIKERMVILVFRREEAIRDLVSTLQSIVEEQKKIHADITEVSGALTKLLTTRQQRTTVREEKAATPPSQGNGIATDLQ